MYERMEKRYGPKSGAVYDGGRSYPFCAVCLGEEEMFGKRKKASAVLPKAYDGMSPAVKSSICTGEKVAGFVDKSGRFEDVMLISKEADLDSFCELYGVKKDEIVKIW